MGQFKQAVSRLFRKLEQYRHRLFLLVFRLNKGTWWASPRNMHNRRPRLFNMCHDGCHSFCIALPVVQVKWVKFSRLSIKPPKLPKKRVKIRQGVDLRAMVHANNFEPYDCPITGRRIATRDHHRANLRAHGSIDSRDAKAESSWRRADKEKHGQRRAEAIAEAGLIEAFRQHR